MEPCSWLLQPYNAEMCRVSVPCKSNQVVHFKLSRIIRSAHLPHDLPARLEQIPPEEQPPPQQRQRQRPPQQAKGARAKKNFSVLCRGKYTYTVFERSGDVIFNGSRTGEELEEGLRLLCELTGHRVEPTRKTARVVNGTYSGRIECVDLQQRGASVMRCLSDFCKSGGSSGENAHVEINFREQFFPGARMRNRQLQGTINVFNNGSYVIIGAKSDEEAEKQRQWLTAVISASWTNSGAHPACAWTAAPSSSSCSEAEAAATSASSAAATEETPGRS